MSASLVGSEMCIRDRAFAALMRCQLHHAVQGVANQLCLGDRATSSLSTCLLYTSDAADDM
eukprot:13743443-Alexandrium_andersonii.AAC.1